MSKPDGPKFVTSWGKGPGDGLYLNDQPFPYYVLADGPMVEQMPGFEDSLHILWLPLIAEGPAPRMGPPDGEPVPEAHNADLTALQDGDDRG